MAISKVVVVDGNNLTVQIDRGVAGRGITDVQPVEIDNALYLEFFFSDGTTETVGPVGTIQYIGQAPIVVNASTISLSTVPINLGGTNATTADAARTNLNAANQDTTISAGTGLSGGGSLAANRTINIANTAVTAGSFGAASKTLTATVNAQGQLTALAETPIAIANTQISGLGTMSTQNANSVAITGGSITGITDLAVLDGGTGASDASGARTNLGAAASAITISAGTGLSGGGDLSANRTLAIANTAVIAGSYGSASNTLSATVNAQGQLTALAATPIAIANTQVSGLGTASTLNAGVALGVATLDAGGTVPLSQIPASIQGGVSYQGSWNAATNTPTIVSSVGSKGYYYVVSVAGSTNINGITDWLPGDWIIFNGSVWEQIDNTDTVQSVNGYVGAVVLNAADVGAPPTTRTISTGTGLSGGGDLSANRTLSISNTAVSAGSYGSASAVPTFTVNAQGQLTAASNTTIAIANTQVSGLGTMSTQNANSVAITGGAIDGATVGATTASTGAFTTLTTSSTVTLNGGTANGVAYLNGSKVLTTGSGLTFDGSRLTTTSLTIADGANGNARFGSDSAYNITGGVDNGGFRFNLPSGVDYQFRINTSEQMRLTSTGLGIGTSSPSGVLQAIKSGANLVIGDGGASLNRFDANTQIFRTGSFAETMRIDGSGNVGIGTSSPAAKLDVSSAGGATIRVSNSTTSSASGDLIGALDYYSADADSASVRAYVRAYFQDSFARDGYLTFGTMSTGGSATERMRLDQSGNLGIGTSSPVGRLSIIGSSDNATQAVISGTTGTTARGLRIATSSTGFQANDTAILDAQHPTNAALVLQTGSTERLRINSSGNVGIGTSSPAVKLDVVGAGVFKLDGSGSTTPLILRNNNTASTQLVKLGFDSSGTIKASINAAVYGNDYMTFNVGSDTERMRIDSSGNVLIGRTSGGGGKLEVDGNYIRYGNSASYTNDEFLIQRDASGVNLKVRQNTNMVFATNDIERARIDSSGNVLIGTTSVGNSSKQTVDCTGTNGIAVVDTGNTSGRTYMTFISNGSTSGSISRVGTTSAVLYNTSSDYRLKDITGPITTSGAYIDSLNPVEGTWKADGSTFVGLIAHEVQEASRTSVATGVKDGDEMQAMDYSNSELIANLIAEVKSLRARVATLESI